MKKPIPTDPGELAAYTYTKKKAFTFSPEIKKEIDQVFLAGYRAGEKSSQVVRLLEALQEYFSIRDRTKYESYEGPSEAQLIESEDALFIAFYAFEEKDGE